VQDAKVVKPFEIVPMLPSNFLNIQIVADEIICTKSLNISKVVSIMYDSTDLSRVGVKESFSDVEVCKKIRILKKGKSVNDVLFTIRRCSCRVFHNRGEKTGFESHDPVSTS
jgi:ribosome-interacting GTPase 1